jgi:hypothetical protein
MKIVYIAHSIGGNVKENLADLSRIIRKINLIYDNVTPLAPYYADVMSLDDSDPAQRARGIRNNIAVFESGIIQEVWLTGSKLTSCMMAEMELAQTLDIKVINRINFF